MIHNPLHPGEIVRELCVEANRLTVAAAAKKLYDLYKAEKRRKN